MVTTLEIAFLIQRELLLFSGCAIVILGFDNLVVDLLWALRCLYRRLTIYRVRPAFAAVDLPQPGHRPYFAVLVPAWDEAEVIGQMLRSALLAFEGHRFHIFVGCYPNDPATQRAIRTVDCPSISIIVNPRNGGTTKGDCLNCAWNGMSAFERGTGQRFDAIVLHDAEDIVSRFEPRVFAHLWSRVAMVQLPVIPVVQPHSPWVAGHYCDEFAESHLKNQPLREALGGGLPSAGVGCMIQRNVLDRLANERGQPFDPDCLTEDYELGLFVASLGLRSAFVRIPEFPGGPIVATRELFPAKLEVAVKQKARWITGIAFAGWDRLGWQTQKPTALWMLWRDRLPIIEGLAIIAAYLGSAIWLILVALDSLIATHWSFQPTEYHGLFALTSFFLIWRLAFRFGCTGRVYGWQQAFLSLPRAFVSNLVLVLAVRRAIMLYFRMQRHGEVVWEKTDHRWPSAESEAGSRR